MTLYFAKSEESIVSTKPNQDGWYAGKDHTTLVVGYDTARIGVYAGLYLWAGRVMNCQGEDAKRPCG